jgi:hypothetical protein
MVIYLRSIYHRTVDRHPKTRSCAVAWLLFTLLACMAIQSPHCDLCDELYFPALIQSTPLPIIRLPLSTTRA